MRVFIGLTEVAGYYKNLKKGFDKLGIDSNFIVFYDNPFHYGGDDEPNRLVKFVKYLCAKAGEIPAKHKWRRTWWRFVRDASKIPLFMWALCKHDVFIFGFNSTFFVPRFYSYWDYPILKFFGKKIICQFHGSDSRPPYINGSIMNTSNQISIQQCIERTQEKKNVIKIIDRYADYIIDIPPQGIFHERPFINWMLVGLPYDKPESTGMFHAGDSSSVRILHAPSIAAAKGTREIRAVIQNLKQKGYPIDFIEIQNMPNQVVVEELMKCDMVIDQVYADYPMPGFATEAAWFGKPVIIGGYACEYWKDWLTEDKTPPTYYCLPEHMEQAIESLILNEQLRLEIGRKSKEFVEREWSPDQVAQRYLQLAQGEVPDSWWLNPRDCQYPYGYGLPKSQIASIAAEMIQLAGAECLQLKDKPELEKLFLDMARQSG